jgi:acetylxylan esterase
VVPLATLAGHRLTDDATPIQTGALEDMQSQGHTSSGVTGRIARSGAGVLASGVVIALSGLALAPAAALAKKAPLSPCAAAHVIGARGSTEPEGFGSMGALVKKIQADFKATVSAKAVVYPAALLPYEPSVVKGDEAVKKELTEEVERCPSQEIVMVGYSQGAQITGDALGGGGGNTSGFGQTDGPPTPPVSSAIASHVIALVMYGDPRRMPGESFDLGTDPGAEGIFPRLSSPNQSLSGFSSVIQSYCDTGDPFCARGHELGAHLTYPSRYNSAANTFVKKQLKAAGLR